MGAMKEMAGQTAQAKSILVFKMESQLFQIQKKEDMLLRHLTITM